MSAGEKVKALRKALGLTQMQLAERSGGAVVQGEIAKVEGGKNKLTSYELRSNLALAFGLPLESFRAYLDDEADLRDAVTAAKNGDASVRGQARVVRVERDTTPAMEVPDNAGPLVHAVTQALDKTRHLVTDATAVIDVLQNHLHSHVAADADLIEKARVWLDAAAALRREGTPVNAATLLDRVTLGKSPRLEPDEDDAFQQEIAEIARKHGVQFGEARSAVEEFLRKGREADEIARKGKGPLT